MRAAPSLPYRQAAGRHRLRRVESSHSRVCEARQAPTGQERKFTSVDCPPDTGHSSHGVTLSRNRATLDDADHRDGGGDREELEPGAREERAKLLNRRGRPCGRHVQSALVPSLKPRPHMER
jgi:hypothetical protein